MLYLTCTVISSVDLAHTKCLMLKIGYLCIVVQFILTNNIISIEPGRVENSVEDLTKEPAVPGSVPGSVTYLRGN